MRGPKTTPRTPPPDAGSQAEEERIRLWRAERARVAEAEKQKRIAARQDELDRQRQDETLQRQQEIDRLLPGLADIEAVRNRLARRARAGRKRLAIQLLACVLLPTLLALGYMLRIATPLYEAQAVVVVTQPGTEPGGDGGLLAAFGGAAELRETFQAHEFLRSRALMEALEAETGIVGQLSSGRMDPLRRLRDLPTFGITRHDQFTRFLRSSVNIQTGLMTLQVRALTPLQATEVAQRAIDLTAAHMNGLGEALVAERLMQADRAVATARQGLRAAQADLTRLQIGSGEIDPRARVEGVFATIEKLTLDAQDLRAEIEQAEVAGAGNTSQVRQLRAREALLQTRIEQQRARLVQPATPTAPSLNTLLLEYELAALEVSIAEEALTAALQSAEAARRDAALSRHVFQVVVPPSPSTHPTAPDALRGALLILILLSAAFAVLRLLVARG